MNKITKINIPVRNIYIDYPRHIRIPITNVSLQNSENNTKFVALCFYGIARSLNYALESIKNNILSVLQKNNVIYKIFFHTYTIEGIYHNPRAWEKNIKLDNELYKLLNADYLQVDDDSKIRKELKLDDYKTKPDIFWKKKHLTTDFFILGQYSKQQSYKMVKNSGIHFDNIIYLRPDVKYHTPFDMNFFDLVNDNTICMPDFQLWGYNDKYPQVNDRFSICNWKNYHIIGDSFSKLLQYSKSKSLHSETYLIWILVSNNIKWKYIRFNFTRIRANGFIIDEIFEKWQKPNSDMLIETSTVTKPLTYPKLGFIILRHINSVETNKYWQHCYDSIRKFYPENYIMIIDDNSHSEFVTEKKITNAHIIKSEYKGRGELLPYIYYLDNQFCETVVILHDSVFINRYIDFIIEDYKFIWDIEHYWDKTDKELEILKVFEDQSLLDFYLDKKLWKGCFGGMTVISYNFLKHVDNKYPLCNLIPHIKDRNSRMNFERVIACLIQKQSPNKTLFGNLHKYCNWGSVKFSERNNYNHLPMTKIWTGR